MKRALAVVGLGLVALLAVRTLWHRPDPVAVPPSTLAVDGEAAARHLAEALRHRTVSHASGEGVGELERFHRWLAATYPSVHAALGRERHGYSLLFTWPGTDPSRLPVLFLAHQDVVPVESATRDDWTHPPFAGVIADGHVWGRGALDMKGTLVALMEALEALTMSGHRPARTLMLALGHDEEVGGAGSLSIARSLRQRGVRLEWVLDEGLVVTQGIIPGASTPVALVGIAEKGLAKIELVAEAPGGHASMPPTRTAPGRLGEALGRLEAAPMPARVDGAARAMLERIAPDMPVAQRLALANLWLLEPLVRRQLTRQASTNALLRSTMAVTVLEGGERANVLVQRARAVLDVRVHPRDSIGSIVAHIARVVGDLGVVARVIDGPFTGEPSPVAATDATGYRVVEQSVRAALPDAIVAPGLLMAGTDARHYLSLADDVYRFMPARLGRKDLERIHGTDERLALTNLEEYVRFYGEVLRRAGE